MLTILFILVIVFAIIATNSPDKKSKKEIANNNAKIADLPDMAFYAKNLTSAQKALNLWPSDSDMLQAFKYISSTRLIYMKMKDGRFVNCPLSQLDITFDKVGALYRIVVKHNNVKFSFYQYAYVFSDKEWEVILDTLTLAGTTRNVSIMGSAYKNLNKANTVLKIIKALS